MTLLEKTKEIMKLRLDIIDARRRLVSCSISYDKWENCYNHYLKMIESDNSEVRAMANGLGNSLYDASVICFGEDVEKYENYKRNISNQLNYIKKLRISNR